VNIDDGAPRIELNYLVPMSDEMPDIHIGHVVSPTLESELGAKAAGQAGAAGKLRQPWPTLSITHSSHLIP
jgi:hypothetical protein